MLIDISNQVMCTWKHRRSSYHKIIRSIRIIWVLCVWFCCRCISHTIATDRQTRTHLWAWIGCRREKKRNTFNSYLFCLRRSIVETMLRMSICLIRCLASLNIWHNWDDQPNKSFSFFSCQLYTVHYPRIGHCVLSPYSVWGCIFTCKIWLMYSG